MRKFRIIIFTVLGLLLFVGVPLIVFNPGVQLRIYMRESVHRPEGLLERMSWHFVQPYYDGGKPLPPSMIHALAELLSDPDLRVRRTAMEFINRTSLLTENENAFFASMEFQKKLKALAYDADGGIARDALFYLGRRKTEETISFFRGILKVHPNNEIACWTALMCLSEWNDLPLLDEILPLANDRRPDIANAAIYVLSNYDDPRVLKIIAGNLQLPELNRGAVIAIDIFHKRFPRRDISAQMDPALLEASRNHAVEEELRTLFPPLIKDDEIRIQAWVTLLSDPSTDSPFACQVDALQALMDMTPPPASAIPALEKLLKDPATDPNVRIRAEAVLKKIRP